jgi:DNA-binding LytR/AlgR family response regulator
MDRVYRCFIVDDNELDQLSLRSQIRRYPFLSIAGVFDSAEKALAVKRSEHPDVLFLDIDLPECNGLDLRRQLGHIPACVFVTSYPEYAVESFDVATLDFLVKPMRTERFAQAMTRLQAFLTLQAKASLLDHTLGSEAIYIKDGTEHVKLVMHELLYLEALKDYTCIVTQFKRHYVLTALGNLLKEPLFQSFVRVHRSYAVQKHYVDKVTSKEVWVQEHSLPIGRTYKDVVASLVKANLPS